MAEWQELVLTEEPTKRNRNKVVFLDLVFHVAFVGDHTFGFHNHCNSRVPGKWELPAR